MALTQPVPDDEIAAEFVASLPADEASEYLARLAPAGPDRERSALRPLSRRRANDPRDLHEAAERVRPVSLAREQVLPVPPGLSGLLPEGLPRGATVAIDAGRGASGATALALALVAAPSAAGSWVATVGLAQVGLAAAAEIGVALERVAMIGPPPPDQWATVVAALVGAFDVIVMTPPPIGRMAEGRRLATRARERGSVLIQLDGSGSSGSSGSSGRQRTRLAPAEADLHFTVVGSDWVGLGQGHGHLEARRLAVEATGRRRAARPRRVEVWFPEPEIETVTPLHGEQRSQFPHVFAGMDGFAGSDAEQLVAAKRERMRRLARQPLTTDGDGVADGWSDAG